MRSRILFTLCLLLLLVAGAVVDDFIPQLDRAFGARVLLLPVIFFTCALVLPFPMMLAFAFVAGILWDARYMVIEDGNGVEFGYSILLYALTGALMQGVRPLFCKGRWEFPLVLVGVATMALNLMGWFAESFRRANFEFPHDYWYRIGTSALMCVLVSPVLFFLIFKLARTTGFRIQPPPQKHRKAA